MRGLEGGLDPARKSEGNWNDPAGGPARLFNYGAGIRVKHIFAFAFVLCDASVNPALKALGWMPQNEGDYSFLHVFRAPAGTAYASSGARIAGNSEVMFPELVPEAWFTGCYRIDRLASKALAYPKM